MHSDNTQLYGILDSEDEALSKMETNGVGVHRNSPDECVPMKEWKTSKAIFFCGTDTLIVGRIIRK